MFPFVETRRGMLSLLCDEKLAEGFMHMGPEDAGRLSILSRGNREAVVRVCVCSGKWLLVLLLLWI